MDMITTQQALDALNSQTAGGSKLRSLFGTDMSYVSYSGRSVLDDVKQYIETHQEEFYISLTPIGSVVYTEGRAELWVGGQIVATTPAEFGSRIEYNAETNTITLPSQATVLANQNEVSQAVSQKPLTEQPLGFDLGGIMPIALIGLVALMVLK